MKKRSPKRITGLFWIAACLLFPTAGFCDASTFVTSPGEQLKLFTITADSNGDTMYMGTADLGAGGPTGLFLTEYTTLNTYWAFFKISDGNYVIANYGTGEILGRAKKNGWIGTSPFGGKGKFQIINPLTGGALNDKLDCDPLLVEAAIPSGSTKYALLTSGPGFTGYVMPQLTWDVTKRYSYYTLQNLDDAVDAAVWTINAVDPNTADPAPPTPPAVPKTGEIKKVSTPVMDSYDAPEFIPGGRKPESVLVSQSQMPYFLAIDRFKNDPAWRIQNSPYYTVNAMGFYHLVKQLNNNGNSGDSTLEISYTYGVTEAQSKTMSASLGVSVGFSVEGDEGVPGDEVKEEFSASVTATFGVSETSSTTHSNGITVSDSLTVAPGVAVGVYALSQTYYVYRAGKSSAVGKFTTPIHIGPRLTNLSYPPPKKKD